MKTICAPCANGCSGLIDESLEKQVVAFSES